MRKAALPQQSVPRGQPCGCGAERKNTSGRSSERSCPVPYNREKRGDRENFVYLFPSARTRERGRGLSVKGQGRRPIRRRATLDRRQGVASCRSILPSLVGVPRAMHGSVSGKGKIRTVRIILTHQGNNYQLSSACPPSEAPPVPNLPRNLWIKRNMELSIGAVWLCGTAPLYGL